ncbi:MAG: hypothetical protein EAZ97_05670 [Bacteroidetes bacterium]|nr:MAG: hypothetical protein EAZ97_05670 [Bacteroidota bacterium]
MIFRFLLFFLFFSNQIFAQISLEEKAILIKFYNQTNGGNWKKSWDLNASPLSWEGVKIDTINKKVMALELPNNNLNGILPAELLNLSALKTLNLSGNNIFGNISNAFAPNLEVLDLSNNQFSSLPTFISLPQAIRISLANNQFSGQIPSVWNSPFLLDLSLANNRFSGDLPSVLLSFPRLQSLNLANNQFTGTIEILYNLTNLLVLQVQNNQFFSQLKSGISNWQNLRILNLSHNLFFDFLPIEIGSFPFLQELDLSYNKFIFILPNEMSQLSSLQKLDLSHNFFEGPFRASLATLSNLSYINLSFNKFNSEIPSLASLGKLSYFNISNNLFFGSFGSSFGVLQNLTYFDASSNQFSSNISSEIGALKNLVYLNLSNNDFRGIIPKEIGNLSFLQELHLENNAFQGDLPENMANLTALKNLFLQNNRFSGLPNLSKLRLNVLKTEKNALTFEDLEPNYNIATQFSYVPQDSLKIISVCRLNLNTGGTKNRYQWFKDNILLPNSNQNFWNVTEKGNYKAVVTNPFLPDLTLISPIIFQEEVQPVFSLGADQTFDCGKFSYKIDAGNVGDKYFWSTGDSTQSITVSAGGRYILTVKKGICLISDTINIIYRGISDNIISGTQTVCSGGNVQNLTGKLSVSNLIPTFVWQASNDQKNWISVSNQENLTPTNVGQITYYRRIVNNQVCKSDTSNILTVKISNIQTQIQKNDVSCFGKKDGEIALIPAGGVPPYQIRWERNFVGNEVKNLDSGLYKVQITDQIACVQNLQIRISEPPLLMMSATVKQASCSDISDGGAIQTKVLGGTPPYTYFWNNGAKTPNLDNIPAQNTPYVLIIRDANRCEIQYSSKIDRSRTENTFFRYEYDNYCASENPPKPQILGVKNGVFSASPEGLQINSQTGEIDINKSQKGNYLVEYRVNSCSFSVFYMNINGSCAENLPNTITPNNDNVNDTWQADLLTRYANANVKIFNVWGQLIFESQGYTKAWNATFQDQELPMGTYYYLIDLKNGSAAFSGFISIIR